MAALTWKNVDETRTSSADAYAKFSDQFTKAGDRIVAGLTDFQNVRKEQAAMAVQRLLEQQTNSKQLNTPNAVETMLQDIPPDLVSPAIFEQIANKRRDLQTSELFDANLNKMAIDNKATEASTALSQDALKTNAQNRKLVDLNIQTEQFKVNNQAELWKAELDSKNASTESTRADAKATLAGIDQKNAEHRLKEAEFGYAKSKDEAALEKAKLSEQEKQEVAKLALAINETPNYTVAKKIIDSSAVSPEGKYQLQGVLSARFPETHAANTATEEAGNKYLPPNLGNMKAFTDLGSLRIKGDAGDTTTFGKLGITAHKDISGKAGRHFKGDTDPGIVLAAQLMQGSLGNVLDRFTGMNDDWHQKNSPNSEHTKGKGMDFTVTGGSLKEYEKAAEQARQAFIQQGLVQGKDFTVKDEANFPSAKATKEHIHVKLTDSGLAKLKRIEEAEKNNVKPLPEEVYKQVAKVNKNSVSLAEKATQFINATQDSLGVSSVRVPEGQDANDPTTLAKAITAHYGITDPQNDSLYSNLIRDTFKQMHSEGNTGITVNDVAAAFMNATTKDLGRFYDLRNWMGGIKNASLNEDKVKEYLRFIGSTRGIEAKNVLENRKAETVAFTSSVEKLNKLNEMLNQALVTNSQGADNRETVQRLREAITTQVGVVENYEDKVRGFIEHFQKEDARKAKQALESNPASENYQY